MKEKTIRTIRISVSAIAAFLILTAMVHVHVLLFDYPAQKPRVSLLLPKAAIFSIAVAAWLLAVRGGRRPRESR